MILRNSITRPADTTAYATGDVINGSGSTIPIELEYPLPSQDGLLYFAHLISSNEASTPTITAYFYSSSFTIAADNAAFTPTDAQNKDYYLGKVQFTSWDAFAANKVSSAKPDAPISIPPTVQTTASKIYVVLVAAGAYTPISGEALTIKLDVEA